MGLVEVRRELTKRSIDQNPASIALTRTSQTPDGAGGFIESSTTLPAQTFRIFLSSMRGSREVESEGGERQINQSGLLAEHDADIQRGDRFTMNGRDYKVEKVDPIGLVGQVVSMQAALEEVV